MKEHVWQQVERELDARRRPTADPEVRRALDRDPAAAAQVALLERRLDRLGDLEPAGRPRRAAVGVAVSLAALALCALVLWAADAFPNRPAGAREQRTDWQTTTVHSPEPLFRERAARSGRVLSWSLSGENR